MSGILNRLDPGLGRGAVTSRNCREAYSQEAISEAFADELAAGTLSWKVLNTDEKANKHFVTDFELVTKAVVLVEYLDGKVVHKEEFIKYVQDSTREFLGQG